MKHANYPVCKHQDLQDKKGTKVKSNILMQILLYDHSTFEPVPFQIF